MRVNLSDEDGRINKKLRIQECSFSPRGEGRKPSLTQPPTNPTIHRGYVFRSGVVMAHATRMSAGDTGLLVIDVQEKLLPLIPDARTLVRNVTFLVEAAQLLSMTVQATEQYPKGLGFTVAELAERLPTRPEKTGFSCCAIPSVAETFRRQARPRVLLAGIETHVCVLNTALDLLALDFRVYVAVDAVSARYRLDHDVALRRMEQAGAVLTTAEACVFEWVGGAEHTHFKAISRLVQDRMKQLAAATGPA
jgi:nicotinamidase-related amidase